jgi:hypothetical protein
LKNIKIRQSVDESNTKEGMEQLIAESFVQNEATTLEQVAIPKEPNADLFDPVESTDAQAEAVDFPAFDFSHICVLLQIVLFLYFFFIF